MKTRSCWTLLVVVSHPVIQHLVCTVQQRYTLSCKLNVSNSIIVGSDWWKTQLLMAPCSFSLTRRLIFLFPQPENAVMWKLWKLRVKNLYKHNYIFFCCLVRMSSNVYFDILIADEQNKQHVQTRVSIQFTVWIWLSSPHCFHSMFILKTVTHCLIISATEGIGGPK